MGRRIIKWQFQKLVCVIVATLLNKYDFFMVIEGGTGIGKSTLAFTIATRIAKEFRRLYRLDYDTVEYYYKRVAEKMGLTEEEFVEKILKLKENKRYQFKPRSALIYTQTGLQKSLASWNSISIPDEMINITFNRDFYSEKQKDIIKMINMFRDHENLTIACVPLFENLDTQIKNLCKMKITVKKRGIAIIHTPNPTVYCKDKWDKATNEKIEREWILKKIVKPNYSKLTTFRGLVKFPQLSRKAEALYQEIKNEKRATILRDDMGIKDQQNEDPFQKFTKRLIDGDIRNMSVIEGFANGIGLNLNQMRGRLVSELTRQGKATVLSHYFWGKKEKDVAKPQSFKGI